MNILCVLYISKWETYIVIILIKFGTNLKVYMDVRKCLSGNLYLH